MCWNRLETVFYSASTIWLHLSASVTLFAVISLVSAKLLPAEATLSSKWALTEKHLLAVLPEVGPCCLPNYCVRWNQPTRTYDFLSWNQVICCNVASVWKKWLPNLGVLDKVRFRMSMCNKHWLFQNHGDKERCIHTSIATEKKQQQQLYFICMPKQTETLICIRKKCMSCYPTLAFTVNIYEFLLRM